MMKFYKLLFFTFIFITGFGVSQWAISQNNGPVLKLGSPMPENLFVELAKAVNPAVVNISSTSTPKGRSYGNDPMLEFLERFYGNQGFQIPKPSPQTALGTGFIIKADEKEALILTNNHVVEGADIINVQLTENSDKIYKAELLGRDSRTDIALIKIKPGIKLTSIPLGSSTDLQVGEWVAAFGNPYGHGHTMTKGIISAKGRSIEDLNRFPLLQTDANINPGNSGGPLVNSRGFVIGVNNAIDARAQGIGFAIPIDEVKPIIAELEKTGKVRQGYIGVRMEPINPKTASHLGIKTEEGVIVAQVDPKTPAEKAGIETYDVITEFAGKKIKTPVDLMNAVASVNVGQPAKLKVLRNNKEKELEIVVAERPEDKKMAAKQQQSKKAPGQDVPFKIGLKLANVDSHFVKEWEIPEDLTGLPVVIEVDSDSVAAQAGIRPGDIIFDVNRKRVRSTADAVKAFQKGSNTLRIYREGNMGFVVIEGKE